MNSDIMHMTDIKATVMQAGFKPEEVKTRVRELAQTFRQRSLRNETKNMEFKDILLDYRSPLCTTVRKENWMTGSSNAHHVSK